MQIKIKIILFLMSLAVISLTFFAGCTSGTGPNHALATEASQSRSTIMPVTAALAQNDLSQVTHIAVTTIQAHWSSGPTYDGITVHPSLLDAQGQKVKWSGVKIPVDIEIYTVGSDPQARPVKGQLVYKGSGTISNWTDGELFQGGGIQVPFSQMIVPSGNSYGWTYVTVHMPDSKTYSAQFNGTVLTQQGY